MKKRLLAALLAGAMAFTMSACGGGGGNDSQSGGGTTGQDSQQSQSGGAGQTDDTNPPSGTTPTPTAGSYTVGIIQLEQHPALDAATQGFQDKLTELVTADGGTVEYSLQNASGETANCATIVNDFVSKNVNLIMANATPALQAAQSGTADIPILGTSVTDYASALDISDWTGKTGSNISGTTDLAPLDSQASMVKELFPDAKNIGLIYCTSEANSIYQINTITPMLEDLGYTCTPYSFTDSNDIASVATSAAANSDVIYIPTDNKAASCTEAIRNVIVPAKIPVVAGEEGICNGCGVATLSISYYDIGVKTGEMAYDILVNGKNPGDMEIQSAPEFTKKYNAAICQELGITPPDGYEAIEAE